MRYTLIAILLAGCNTTIDTEAYPLEIVKCTHPDSRYEAVVDVSVDDDQKWDEVRFNITQGENDWETSLWEPDETTPTWDTRMQLYELNCLEDYTHEFFYVD